MLLLKNIIQPIAYYKDREKKIQDVIISNVQFDIDKEENVFLFATANNYTVSIKFIQPEQITLNSRLFIDCTCPSFNYEFAYANKANLIYPDKYLNRPPREKNIHRLPGMCKHLYATGRYIFENRFRLFETIKKLKET